MKDNNNNNNNNNRNRNFRCKITPTIEDCKYTNFQLGNNTIQKGRMYIQLENMHKSTDKQRNNNANKAPCKAENIMFCIAP